MNIASIGSDLGKTTFHLVALGELPFAGGTMSSKDTNRSSTFLSNPAVKKK
jgi:hypothetical protein